MSSSLPVSLPSAAKRLPVLFLSHGGGPAHLMDAQGSMFAPIDRGSASAAFMRSLRDSLRPYMPAQDREKDLSAAVRCVLVVSAHWEEAQFTVDYQPGPATSLVYDYYGFPEETYAPALVYPAKTDLAVADRVVELLKEKNIPVQKKARGFDHGVFIPLKVAFPKADVPVVQLSLKSNLDNAQHIALGEALQPLREEGVLIIGSGQITHNLRELRQARSAPEPRAVQFCEWVNDFLTSTCAHNYAAKKAQLSEVERFAPHFYFNHPRAEHFTPLAVVFGAAFAPGKSSAAVAVSAEGETEKETDSDAPRAKRLYSEVVLGSMGIDSYVMF